MADELHLLADWRFAINAVGAQFDPHGRWIEVVKIDLDLKEALRGVGLHFYPAKAELGPILVESAPPID